jgi:Fe-S cluster biosynthesis and repair protein YggX
LNKKQLKYIKASLQSRFIKCEIFFQIKEEAKYNEWLRRQALLDEEEEERKQAARKKQLHQQLDQQLQDKTVAVFAKKADVVEEREAVDAIIHQVYFV